jgi:hypothetical protein
MVFIVIVSADSPQGPDRGSGLEKNGIGNSPVTDAGSISTSTGAPTTTKPNKLIRRDSGLLTDNDVDSPPAVVEGPPQIESVLFRTLFYSSTHLFFFFWLSYFLHLL